MSEKLETSKQSGPHFQLARMAGNWQGIAKIWFEPEKPADESPVSGNIRLSYNGMFAIHEYRGSCFGKPLEGMAIIGYNLALERFETAWIDSFHTGTAIMFSEGVRHRSEMNVKGTWAYVTPETEQFWGWRSTIEFNGDDQLVLTAYNISPEGEEVKATETVYNRVA